MSDLTLEELAAKLDNVTKIATTAIQKSEKVFKAMEEKEEEKTAMHDEEEKKEAKRASRLAAIKQAMDDNKDDPEKQEAAIRAAMEEDPEDKKEAFGKPKKGQEEEKKENEHVAAIIEDKKNDLIKKILTANSYNASNLKSIEDRLKKASIEQVKAEWQVLEPFFGNANTSQPAKPEAFIPYYASHTDSSIDANQLSASSPDSAFAKLSTKDLLEGKVS